MRQDVPEAEVHGRIEGKSATRASQLLRDAGYGAVARRIGRSWSGIERGTSSVL